MTTNMVNMGFNAFIDDDTMATATATNIASAESVKAYVDSVAAGGGNVAVGTLFYYGGTSAPAGSLVCDGSAISRTTYSELFTAIGTTWGVGDGSTTFNLPNLPRRTLVGAGGTGTAELGNAVGDTGGAETHTLVVDEMPAHTHNYGGTQSQGSTSGNLILATGGTAFVSSSTGDNQPHNIIQPSAVVLMCIAYQANVVADATAASQAEMETATSNTVFSTPGRQQLHPGHPKAWVVFNGTGTVAIDASYNVTSITDSATGQYVVNLTTAFSSADYCTVSQSKSDPALTNYVAVQSNAAATDSTFPISIVDLSGTLRDSSRINVAFFGDQ